MRFNDTLNHSLLNAGGHRYVRATNVTSSAATIRIFNSPDFGKSTIDIATVDADNALAFDRNVPANCERVYPVNPQFPVIVRNGTANAVNWSLE